MKIDHMRVTCQKCKEVSDIEMVVDCPVVVYAACMKAARCPKCGSSKLGFGGEHVGAPGPDRSYAERVLWWDHNGDRGISSNTIFHVFAKFYLPLDLDDIPHDPADFRRCWRLLELIPEWKQQLPLVARYFPYWKPFIDRWKEMEALYLEEVDNKSGQAPKLYALMKVAEKEAEEIKKHG